MRLKALLTVLLSLFSTVAFGQTDRGTITGSVTDVTAAVLPGVSVVAISSQTGARYETLSTETGNYIIAQLPVGSYQLAVELPGFKKYIRQGITVLVAQTLRIDVSLEVGAPTEEVSVTADATLLRTESTDISTNVNTDSLDNLPILSVGAKSSSYGIRNPLATATMVPGVLYQATTDLVVNGLPNNSSKVRVDGQDASNSMIIRFNAHTQQGVDAIQETSIQTSNFAAEYGQVGGGLFNQTTKSGTNNFHGTLYDYLINEALHAGTPYRPLDADGKLPRGRDRKNNYGGTVGGPVAIPHVYEGQNRTFFFFSWEQYREKRTINFQTFTVPTPQFRAGDFSALLTGRSLGTDPLGRPIMEGTLYDPLTERIVNGQSVREPFPGNIIPRDRLDPVALKVQSYIPLPTVAGQANNWLPVWPSERITTIPSIKIDHNLSSRHKLSFYFSKNKSASQYSPENVAGDGLPDQITTARGAFNESATTRLNYDWTISPSVLFHFGTGYQHQYYPDDSPYLRQETGFDALAEFGLPGQVEKKIIPSFTGLSTAQGGMKNMGPGGQTRTKVVKPTGVASLSWIKDNHAYKFGADWRIEGLPKTVYQNTSGVYGFSAEQTGLGRIQNLGGGTVGHPYASFLMGLVNTGSIAPPTTFRLGRQVFAMYAQDTWKVTSRLTMDYGLRWDYSGFFQEQYGRLPSFSPTVINSRTGTPGGVIFEGEGPGRCGCKFARSYPYAFGPRLGAAWQANTKTVIRMGLGVNYNTVGDAQGNGLTGAISATNTYSSPGTGQAAFLLKNGVPAPQPWPRYDSGLGPLPGTTNFIGTAVDPGVARPARMLQWSISIQREISPNFAIDVSYVANRGVWWEANGLRNINANSPDRLRAFGLDATNAADFALLTSAVSSTTAVNRGFGPTSKYMPYAGFPTSSTVAQMLRPFPQFGNIGSIIAPLGKTWYDGLQAKAVKRLSHGLDFSTSFAWQKELSLGVDSNVNNVFDYKSNKTINSNSRPLTLSISGNYRTPVLNAHPVIRTVVRDWEIGAVMQYASGIPILAPAAQSQLNNALFAGSSYANRVSGEPLFTKDLNCHCFDPLKAFVLNPKAWVDPALGQYGTGSAYYSDYRQQRRPSEAMSIARAFRLREGVELNIRAEWDNVFNRTPVVAPTSTNAKTTQQFDPATGLTLTGFGRIGSALDVRDLPRNGTIVMRIRF